MPYALCRIVPHMRAQKGYIFMATQPKTRRNPVSDYIYPYSTQNS